MKYETVSIEGNWVEGHIVVDTEARQVATIHVYESEQEADEIRVAMEEAALIAANWPRVNDPEVQKLVNSEDWQPTGQENFEVLTNPVYRLHQAAETVARKRAGLESAAATDERDGNQDVQ